MPIKLDHTIVHSNDPRASATFYTELFGLPPAKKFGPFLDVKVANEVTLAFLSADGMEVQKQRSSGAARSAAEQKDYAFLVDDGEFDAILGRIQDRDITYYSDPAKKQRGEINRHFGGRGCYFDDPNGHLLENMTTPYGEWTFG